EPPWDQGSGFARKGARAMRLRRCTGFTSTFLLLAASGPALADNPPTTPVDAATLAARIDDFIAKKWAEKNVQPAPPADDAEFLRRVYLDLVGRIPRTSEVREFLADKHPQKRQRLVSRLLDNPLHVSHLGTTWKSILLPTTNQQQLQLFAGSFKVWLDKQIQENVPYDKMVREILTANLPANANLRGGGALCPVKPNTNSPVRFYQAHQLKAENPTSSTPRLFLGGSPA